MSGDLPSDAQQRYLPTLARARKEGLPLPAGEPLLQERWAALFVIAIVLRRRSWKEEVIQHVANLAGLPRTPPPPPGGYFPGTYSMLEKAETHGACPDCPTRMGFRKCRVCDGSGQVRGLSWSDVRPCSCIGGYVQCPTCRGEGTTHRVTLRYFEDATGGMREFLLPSHLRLYGSLLGLESAMEGAAQLAKDPPDELRCHDLTGRTGGSAYRGGVRIVRPTFHGHDYGDTIDRAVEVLRAFGGGAQVLHHDIRAFAWPLLRLQYPGVKDLAVPREIAVFPDHAGQLCLFGDTGRP